MFKRSDRLRELFLQEISRLLGGYKDPRLSGFLTVTDLELSKDAKNARVFYSVLGSPEDRRSTAQALERSVHFLRRSLFQRLRLKFIPQISFQYDETPERAHRIEDILSSLGTEGFQPKDPGGAELAKLAAKRRRRKRR